jgi:hypothetical protein
MRRVSLSSGSLLLEDLAEEAKHFQHDLGEWAEVFQPPAVHELLFDPSRSGPPAFLAMVAARHRTPRRPIVWIDPFACLYPPALAADRERLYLLRPWEKDLAWAATECLRCKHIGAVIAVMPHRLTRVEVRRLRLAAENGNSLGLLLRPNLASAGAHIYSASSRWLVSPARGERTIQRWHVEHMHGHGRQFGETFIVEKYRATGQTHFVHPSASLGDHSAIAPNLGKIGQAAS